MDNEQLKEAQQTLGISNNTLAQVSGYHLQSISNMRSGRQQVPRLLEYWLKQELAKKGYKLPVQRSKAKSASHIAEASFLPSCA